MKNNEFRIRGTIYSITPDVSNSTGTFVWTEVILAVMGGKYTEYIQLQGVDENLRVALHKYKAGDTVDVLFKISGRLVPKDGREVVYNNNQLININKQL
jgi:hypothetical protein